MKIIWSTILRAAGVLLQADAQYYLRDKPSQLSLPAGRRRGVVRWPFIALTNFLRNEEGQTDHDRDMQSIGDFLTSENLSRTEKDKTEEEIVYQYYEYARQEIDREDEITYRRLSLTLVFQGFLFTALALVSSRARQCFPIQKMPNGPLEIECETVMPFLVLSFFLSFSGFVISVFAFHGIDASRRSLLWAKDQWVRFNRLNGYHYPHVLPQLTKRANRHSYDHVGEAVLQVESANGSPLFLKQLSEQELIDGSYFKKRRGGFLHKDEGWDFSLSIPALLIVMWLIFGLSFLYLMATS